MLLFSSSYVFLFSSVYNLNNMKLYSEFHHGSDGFFFCSLLLLVNILSRSAITPISFGQTFLILLWFFFFFLCLLPILVNVSLRFTTHCVELKRNNWSINESFYYPNITFTHELVWFLKKKRFKVLLSI